MPPKKKLSKSHDMRMKAECDKRDISSPEVQSPKSRIMTQDSSEDLVCCSRRSHRTRVFNSRFKDMEVQLTPKRHQTKLNGNESAKNRSGKVVNGSKKSPKPISGDEMETEKRKTIRRKRRQKQAFGLDKIKQCKQDTEENSEAAYIIRCKKNNSGSSSPPTESNDEQKSLDVTCGEVQCVAETKHISKPSPFLTPSTDLLKASTGEQSEVCIKLTPKDELCWSVSSSSTNVSLLEIPKNQLEHLQPVETIKAESDGNIVKTKRIDLSPSNGNSQMKPTTVDDSCLATKTLSSDGHDKSHQIGQTVVNSKCVLVSKTSSAETVVPVTITNVEDLSKLLPGVKENESCRTDVLTAIKIVKESKDVSAVSKELDMDWTNKYLDSSVDVKKGDKREGASAGDQVTVNSVKPKADTTGEREQAKVMEEEMMNLLNLFLTDSEQKKSGQLLDVGKDIVTTEQVGDGHSIMVIDGATVDEQLATSGKVHSITAVSGDGVSNDEQTNDATFTESQVHVLPLGSTVFLVNKEVAQNPEGGSEEIEEEQALPHVTSGSTAVKHTTGEDCSVSAVKQVHFLVKTPKNKVEINSDGILSCTSCGAKVESQSEHVCKQRVDNLLHINEDGMFCCTKCEYKTEKKVNWYKHKLKHQERRYHCPKCDYKASTSSNLKRHLLSHDDVRAFGCKICWATFPQKIHLLRHIKSKHQPHSVQCSYCDFVCAEVQPDLVLHMKNKHPEFCNFDKDGNPIKDGNGMLEAFLRYKCDKCNLYTFNRKDLQQHMKVHKKGPELKFFCEMCSFVTECESRLKRHMLTHTKEKPYSCSMCNYRGSLREHVKRHLKTKHNLDVSFGQQKKIRRYASKKSKSKDSDSLLLEGRFHGKKPYPLSDTRNSEKHFACNFCSMKFTKLISLFKHVHVQHSQMMPPDSSYSCVVCDYTTNQYKRLLLHMRKVHSTTNCMNTPQKQVYVCMSCSYSTPYRLFLHAHLKKEHNMQIVTDKYMMDASKHSSAMIQTTEESNEKKPGSIIKNVVKSKMGAQNSPGSSKDSKMVLLQLTPDGPMTPVVISMGADRDSEASNPSTGLLNGTDTEYPIMETGITDAGCPLDMQCEVIFDDELGQVLHDTQVTQDPVVSTSVEVPVQIPAKDLTQVIQEMSTSTKTTENVIESESTREEIDVKSNKEVISTGESETSDSVQNEETDGVNQVLHLSSGDFLEINGQIYKIEMEENTTKSPDS